jgi:hypothetical protein
MPMKKREALSPAFRQLMHTALIETPLQFAPCAAL